MAHALMWKCLVCDLPRRDSTSAYQFSEKLIALATEQGLEMYLLAGTMIRAWTLVHQGSGVDGLPALHESFESYCQISQLFRPYYGSVLADALLFVQEAKLGLAVLTKALRLAEESGELFWLAEMLNLQGKFLLLADHKAQAERNFQRAVDVARGQSATSLQLRASTSLARLWRDQGNGTEARDLLAPIYRWFTEGFDTPDLREAKGLLQDLN
jgi:predicted ATPase